MEQTPVWMWATFAGLIVTSLALDMGVFHRKAKAVSPKEALFWSIVWIVLALVFGACVWHVKGSERGFEYLSGYLVEKSLSVDNLFVFLVIFSYFGVPKEYQHRVLMWGILGAIVMRGVFVWLGSEFVQRFDWAMYVFGGILVFTAVKLLLKKEGPVDPQKNPVVKLFKRCFGTSDTYDGPRFFTRIDGRRVATPLFIVVLVVETTDVVFAVDSIPAIFGLTVDPFIVYTSNIFAILGLRSMYFLLAHTMDGFRFLKHGLVVILAFVGMKMILHKMIHIPIELSLGIIAGILTLSIMLSMFFKAPHIHEETAVAPADPPLKNPKKRGLRRIRPS